MVNFDADGLYDSNYHSCLTGTDLFRRSHVEVCCIISRQNPDIYVNERSSCLY